MKKRFFAWAMPAFLVMGISVPSNAREITHDLGVTEVADQPQRIVVLEFSFLDALASVGVSPIGIADDNDRSRVNNVYGRYLDKNWTAVGTRKTPSFETIASLHPDLIIADTTRHAQVYAALSQIAPTVVLNSFEGDYDDTLDQMAVIGRIIGKEAEMTARLAEHKANITSIAEKLRPIVNGRTGLLITVRPDSIATFSPKSFTGQLLERLGFGATMNRDDAPEATMESSLEKLSVLDPEILFTTSIASKSITDTWADDTIWREMRAVQSGSVYAVRSNNWNRLRGTIAADLIAEDALRVMSEQSH